MKAYLILEDGTVYEGISIGARKEVISELVFNTGMTGYLEALTDPAAAGQAIVMTYPLIGNYGVCEEDMESIRPWADAFIVREISEVHSNFRAETGIEDFLLKYDIPGIAGIDTRELTKKLREHGSMKAMISCYEYSKEELAELVSGIKSHNPRALVTRVSCIKRYTLTPESPKRKLAVLDLGLKLSHRNALYKRDCELTVYPSDTKAKDIMSGSPKGIFISSGPGNPKEYKELIDQIRELYNSGIAIMAVGLGHQLLALATGADTYKLKSGHRGSNYPVKDLETGRAYIGAQNHAYAVDTATLDKQVAVESFVNVNDQSNEGLKYLGKNIISVQYYPDDAKNALYSLNLFDKFISMMEENL